MSLSQRSSQVRVTSMRCGVAGAVLRLVFAIPMVTTGAASTGVLHAQAAPPISQAKVIGRWDITMQGPDGPFPSWLEVRLSGSRTLVGQMVARVGSTRPIAKVEYANGTMRFSLPAQWEQGAADFQMEGTADGDRMTGWMIDPEGKRVTWSAVRAPTLRRSAEPVWGTPIDLFNGKDLSGWIASREPNQWKVVNGVLTNPRSGANLITTPQFTDFTLHAEFRYPKGGNSGLYLRGRYEVQIEDSGGLEPGSLYLGGVYGFLAPNENAARAAGEWQTYDITLVGRQVTIVLNGKTVISRQDIPGITGGALDSNEGAPGPIMLQGDHTAVEFRKLVLTPAK